MTDYKNEYQKYADSAVRDRLKEEGFGRLRLSVFFAVAGPLAIFLTRVLHWDSMPRIAAIAIVGMAPLAVLLFIINYIRLPNDSKASPAAILMLFITLIGAGANFALANILEPSLMKIISP